MACRPAPACGAALLEASTLWPYRNRASDGICASPKHSMQNPTSDHEPDVRGIAHAFDLTHDPVHGVDCNELVRLLVAREDPRVKYLIWNRQIIRSYKTSPKHPRAWTPQAYTGSNPHTKHVHVSVWTEHENDTSPWFAVEEDDDMTPDQNARLERVEKMLLEINHHISGPADKGARLPRLIRLVEALKK